VTPPDQDAAYETSILCPDTPAGSEALHERMAEGWEFFCHWVEITSWDKRINHVAMRRPRTTESGGE